MSERQQPDYRAKCFRAEERKVVPGLRTTDADGNAVTRTDMYVVVEGTTERYMGQSGVIYMSTSHMRPTEFFQFESTANQAACAMHRKIGCTSPDCGWTPKQAPKREQSNEDEIPF